MDRKEIRYDLQQAMPIIEIIYTVQELYKELWEIIDIYYGGKNNGENI